MDDKAVNLPGTFLEIARLHKEAMEAKNSTTILNGCPVCGCETEKHLHRESALSEFYKCSKCNVIFEYRVR